MIKLNGGFGEGGGAIIRVALALSTITQKPFQAYDIRKGRPKPGLKNQHLCAVNALSKICCAQTEGAELGSEKIKFNPGIVKGGDYKIDVETSGALSLVLQSILPPLMFADKPAKIELIGGTCGKWAPSAEYFKEIFLPQIQKYANINFSMIQRGYYPAGGGNIKLTVNPKYKLSDFKNFEEFDKNLKENVLKINLTNQFSLVQIKGISHASLELQEANVAERQARTAELILKNKYKCPITIEAQYSKTLSKGSGITLWSIFSKEYDEIDIKNPIRIGADSLGERGKKAEIVGQEAADSLIKEIESKAPVDSYLADQILPFMALVGGSAIKTSEITNHCKTNMYVIKEFLGETFKIDEKESIISTIN